MRITKIRIKNFRSIKDQDIVITPLLGLIGSNNAGKSNILKAINLVLGERYPTSYVVKREDFYNEDPSNNIEIEIAFDTAFNSYNKACDAVLFSTVYNEKENNWETKLKARISDNAEYQSYTLKGEVRDTMSTIYISADRDFTKHLEGSSEWGLFGKIKAKFNESFSEETRKDINKKFEEIKSSLVQVKKFEDFEEAFKKSFKEHVLSSQNKVDLEIRPFDPKHYYKHLEIIPQEYLLSKNLNQLGDGTKNLILIALFRAYAQVFGNSTIFLIEEPELYLHPQGRADLFNIFKLLALNRSQIIYTTHSPELIDIEYMSSIGVVKKRRDGENYYTEVLKIKEPNFCKRWANETGIDNVTVDSIKLFLKNLSDAETNKGFFAEKIVLVEGKTEKWALQGYAEKMPNIIDLEKENVEIISVSGKNNINKFYLIFTELKYPVYVIFDGDKKKKEGEETNRRLLKMLGGPPDAFPATTISDKFTIFEEDFETELKSKISNYEELKKEAQQKYGLSKDRGKEIIARYIATTVIEIPTSIKSILTKIKNYDENNNSLTI